MKGSAQDKITKGSKTSPNETCHVHKQTREDGNIH